MNRPIKFRAWDGKKFTLDDVGYASEGYIDAQQLNEVFSAETIVFQQFTGLLDKNGKEIYEGDLFQDDEDGSCDVVEWDNEQSGWCTKTWYSVGEFADSTRYHEIIGNIYENPELIK